MSQTEGRATGFSRLINEKTMILDDKPVDRAIERLCPSLITEDEVESLRGAQSLLEKFVRDLVQKMRSNTFRMLFDEPLFITNHDDVVWWADDNRNENVLKNDMEVLLGIRRPPGTKIDPNSKGYVLVNIHQAPRFEDSQTPDLFEHVRSSNGKRLSPRGVCRVQHRIMQLTLRNLEARYNGAIRVDDLPSPDKRNSFRLQIAISQRFFDHQSKEEDEDSGKSQKASKTSDDEEESDDEERPRKTPSSRMTTVTEEELEPEHEYTTFSIRFYTGMNYLSKERIYLIARPYPYDLYTYKSDQWRFFYRLRELQILRPVFKADQYRRLRAMAGLVRLCSVDPDLDWVSGEHLRHLVLHLIQSEIDSGCRWQRLSLVQCIREMLNGLKQCCTDKSLSHYFVDKLNLVEVLDVGQHSRSCVRFSVLAKSDSAMIRAVDRYFDASVQKASNKTEPEERTFEIRESESRPITEGIGSR